MYTLQPDFTGFLVVEGGGNGGILGFCGEGVEGFGDGYGGLEMGWSIGGGGLGDWFEV